MVGHSITTVTSGKAQTGLFMDQTKTLLGLHSFKLANLLAAVISAALIYFAVLVVKNVYFHPLSKYPGPKSWAATYLPYLYSNFKGRVCYDCKVLHDRYGDVVRVSPTELSYRSAAAWKHIYANRAGHILLPKEPHFYPPSANGAYNIVSSPHSAHAKIRRNVSHAFSEKALRQQEDLMQVHINLLIKRLRERADGKTPVNIVAWYNYCTFDLIGELAFGKSFGCLQNGELHPWVRMQFTINRALPFASMTSILPFGNYLLPLLLPKGTLEAGASHIAHTEDAVKKRLEMKVERPDFLHFIDREISDEGERLSFNELVSNAGALINAGSETTATLLSGTTFYLLRNPQVLARLCTEVRTAFKSEEEITILSVANLTYMLAVLDEGMRIYPPVPTGMPRTIPEGGEEILNRHVPGGTVVSVNNWACYHSEENFRDAEEFVPERWLGSPDYAGDNKAIWQPFSVGPRVCIGRNLAYAEMRLILARILFNFDMKLQRDSEAWASDQRMWVIWDKPAMNVTLTSVKH